jgi:hypothetical protein
MCQPTAQVAESNLFLNGGHMTTNNWTINGHLANHLIVARGGFIQENNCASIQDAISRMIASGNTQVNMNYIISVRFAGSTNNWTVSGEPVQFTPAP